MTTATRRNAFQIFGSQVEATSAQNAAIQAGLDWHVQLAELQALAISNDGVNTIPVKDRFATVRTNKSGDQSVLGTVGGRYKVFQNGEMFSALDALVDSGEARYSYAGELSGGSQVYMVMELPKEVKIAGDPHAAYLLARTSHDGSSSLGITPVINRLYCSNQIKGIFRKQVSYSVKHTTNAKLSVADMRKVIDVVYQGITWYEELANHLIKVEIDDNEAKDIFAKMWTLPSEIANTPYSMLTTGQRRKYNTVTRSRDTALSIYKGSTGTQENIQGTAFGAMQAIIEYADHFSHKDEYTRAERVISGSADKIKNRAVTLLTKGA